MTTLFSVFGPFLMFFSMKNAILVLISMGIILSSLILLSLLSNLSMILISTITTSLFPNASFYSLILLSFFSSLSLINLFSLMVYSYPVTTTLGFNLSAAFSCWIGGIFIQMMKYKSFSSLLPVNSPWYLVPFLCVVELVSIIVRPITLCFRLLANMTAGHVLIALICKMKFIWILGVPFGLLEMMVALVQGFVFSMLISVYLEEAFSH